MKVSCVRDYTLIYITILNFFDTRNVAISASDLKMPQYEINYFVVNKKFLWYLIVCKRYCPTGPLCSAFHFIWDESKFLPVVAIGQLIKSN